MRVGLLKGGAWDGYRFALSIITPDIVTVHLSGGVAAALLKPMLEPRADEDEAAQDETISYRRTGKKEDSTVVYEL